MSKAIEAKESWHLSKSVPVSLIFAIIIQTGGFIWLLANMDNRLTNNTDDIAELKRDVERQGDRQHDVDVKLGRIDEKLSAVAKSLESISRKLDD